MSVFERMETVMNTSESLSNTSECYRKDQVLDNVRSLGSCKESSGRRTVILLVLAYYWEKEFILCESVLYTISYPASRKL